MPNPLKEQSEPIVIKAEPSEVGSGNAEQERTSENSEFIICLLFYVHASPRCSSK